MSFDPVRATIQALGHESRKQHNQGNHDKSAGLSMIAFGIFLLPIPIIGLPLIGFGIWKLCK
jgi:hypothetical protein